jgi:hypothetical protein
MTSFQQGLGRTHGIAMFPSQFERDWPTRALQGLNSSSKPTRLVSAMGGKPRAAANAALRGVAERDATCRAPGRQPRSCVNVVRPF